LAGLTVIAAVVLLGVLLPLALLRDLFRLGRGAARLARNRQAVPLPQRNVTRATAGAFVLAACAVLAGNGFPVIGVKVTAGVAAFALLYFVVGIAGARNATVDVMAAFWWAVLALGGLALLVYVED
jgi:hypothetical protein